LTKKKKLPVVGDNIETRCAKCKKNTPHEIIDLKKNGTIGKVHCLTCEYDHAYRQPRAKKTQAEKDAALQAKRLAKAHAEFDEMMSGTSEEAAIPYAVDASFAPDDIVSHKTFGLGKVLEMITPNKMVVQFRDGQRILVCVIAGPTDNA